MSPLQSTVDRGTPCFGHCSTVLATLAVKKLCSRPSLQGGSDTCHIYGRVDRSMERSTFAAPDVQPKPHHPLITRHARRSDASKSVDKVIIAYKPVPTQKRWAKTGTGATIHGIRRSGMPAGPQMAPRKWIFLPIWRVTRQKSYARNPLDEAVILRPQTISGDNLTWIHPLLQNGA